jgi:hypothetical protein
LPSGWPAAPCGFTQAADAKRQKHSDDFRKVDPTGRQLNILDPQADIRESPACQGKWMNMLEDLEAKYGGDFLKRYVACLRKGVLFQGAHHKLVDGRRELLGMQDIVRAMSEAAGEDLRPWFIERGISLPASPAAGQ